MAGRRKGSVNGYGEYDKVPGRAGFRRSRVPVRSCGRVTGRRSSALPDGVRQDTIEQGIYLPRGFAICSSGPHAG